LKNLYADVYLFDLSKAVLTADDIKTLTNNTHGIDITSVVVIEPHAVFYDWHVHEAFNEEPDEIYVPYGSGRLMENYLTWQQRTVRNELQGARDQRLRASAAKVATMDVLGAEPEALDSIADKLTKPCNPFALLKAGQKDASDSDVSALKRFAFSGKNTGVYPVPEAYIKKAYDILSQFLRTEPSGSAGLALYLQRFDQGLANPERKVLVVNTGRGLYVPAKQHL
jgi:hypothetical protein